MKWKAKVVLVKVSFDEIHSWDIQGYKVEGESGVNRSIIHEFHSWDMQGNQMKGEVDVSGNMIDELHSSDIHGDQMEGKNGVT